MRRKSRKFIFMLAALIALSACLTAPQVFAGESTETASKKSAADDIRDNLADVKNELNQAKSEYDQAMSELKTLDGKIQALEAQIQEKTAEIEATEAQIADYAAQIEVLTARIAELEIEISDQNSALNQRLRIMYETSDDSLLVVLFESKNFVDFLSNMEMVRRIHESDKAFLQELKTKLDEVETKKAELQAIEDALREQKAALEEQKAQLDAAKAELASAKKRQQEIRDAALEDIERLEKESRRLQNELASMISQWGDYAGGAMAWPVIGKVTSEYGMRVNPVTHAYVLHAGIDIGVSSGTPVHAAADGIVYFAGWNSGGYGNLVILDNGSGITTLYAHNSSFAVSAGQVVNRGDVIAYAGSTGNSTGPHCHFEVRQNGSPQNPRGWLG